MGKVDRFEGRIAAVGCGSGMRIVTGIWERSPFGPFVDVMLQKCDGGRLLLAPSQAVADYVSSTYTFDEVVVTEVAATLDGNRIELRAGPLQLTLESGSRTLLGRALCILPEPLAVHPLWLQTVNPVVGLLAPGARTAGTAGHGRREYYGVRDLRRITSMSGTWYQVSLGGLGPVTPPVTFSFSSMPASPAIASVVTTIRPGRAGNTAN